MGGRDVMRGLGGRRLPRRGFLQGALAASAGGAALYAIGCSSSTNQPEPTKPPTSTPVPDATQLAGKITPVMLTAEFKANEQNRFAVGLLDASGGLVKNATVHLKFFTVESSGGTPTTGTLRGEGDMTYNELNVTDAHAHDKSTGAAASNDAIGFYLTNAPFDQVGTWGVEMSVTQVEGTAPQPVQAPFNVLADWVTPGPGAEAPKSQNDTLATTTDPASICSRDPICPLHDKVIADSLAGPRPTVVQFSTPAFCQTRFCGPVLEVLLQQVPAYQDRVDFIHIEVWQDHQLQKYRPAVQEWHLPGEPYTFFMNKEGFVVGRLESIFTEEELASALEQLVKL